MRGRNSEENGIAMLRGWEVPYHDRMLVILRPEDYAVWLDADMRRAESLTPLLRPYVPEGMSAYAGSPLVNSPSNADPRCVEPSGARPG